jgi:hypothetical protein
MESMAPALPPHAAPPAGAVPCLHCGYDLRGSPQDGRCPECAAPVRRSLVPTDELRHAPARWLRSLSWGTRLVLAMLVAPFAFEQLRSDSLAQKSIQTYTSFYTLFSALFLSGAWLLTRPQARFGPSGPALRWSLRLVSAAPLVSSVLTHVALYLSLRMGSSGLFRVAQLVWIIVTPLPLLLFLHLRGLALRVLNPSLAEHCAIVGVATSAFFCLAQVMVYGGVTPPLLELAATVGMILFYLWALYLLVRFSIAFHRAWKASVTAWGAAGTDDAPATTKPYAE